CTSGSSTGFVSRSASPSLCSVEMIQFQCGISCSLCVCSTPIQVQGLTVLPKNAYAQLHDRPALGLRRSWLLPCPLRFEYSFLATAEGPHVSHQLPVLNGDAMQPARRRVCVIQVRAAFGDHLDGKVA